MLGIILFKANTPVEGNHFLWEFIAIRDDKIKCELNPGDGAIKEIITNKGLKLSTFRELRKKFNAKFYGKLSISNGKLNDCFCYMDYWSAWQLQQTLWDLNWDFDTHLTFKCPLCGELVKSEFIRIEESDKRLLGISKEIKTICSSCYYKHLLIRAQEHFKKYPNRPFVWPFLGEFKSLEELEDEIY